jgi:ferredoxin-NADP reductase
VIAGVLTSDIAQLAGLLLVGVVLLRGMVSCLDAWRRTRTNREAGVLELERLRAEVAREALSFWKHKEQAQLSWSGVRKFQVDEVATGENEDGDIASFTLVPHDQRPLPLFQPGQFLTFVLRVPGETRRVIRCYSLSDAPRRDRYRVTIKHVPGGLVSGFFHSSVRAGDIVDVKAPAGNFCLEMEEDFPIVLIAGGVGVTPMLSMFNAVATDSHEREVWFVYAAQRGTAFVQREHLESLVESCPNAHLLFVVSDPTPEDEKALGGTLDGGSRVRVEKGYVTGDLLQEILPSSAARTHSFYTCGPPPMMSAVVGALEDWGVSDDRIHYEAFGPASVRRKKSPATPDAAAPASAPIEVNFSKSEKVVAWDPAAETLFSLAEASGVAIECNCLAGNCGTCEIAVRDGEFAYVKDPSYDAAPGTCLACIAVPKTNITLDA